MSPTVKADELPPDENEPEPDADNVDEGADPVDDDVPDAVAGEEREDPNTYPDPDDVRRTP